MAVRTDGLLVADIYWRLGVYYKFNVMHQFSFTAPANLTDVDAGHCSIIRSTYILLAQVAKLFI